MSSPFEFTDTPSRGRSRHPAGPSWLHSFSATFAAVLLAGILLLLGIRFYVMWSVRDALERVKQPAPAKV